MSLQTFPKIPSPARLALLLLVLSLTGCASMRGLHTHASAIDPGQLETGRSLSNVRLSAAAWPQDS